MTGFASKCGVAGEAGPNGNADHETTYGTGGRQPSDDCGAWCCSGLEGFRIAAISARSLRGIETVQTNRNARENDRVDIPDMRGTGDDVFGRRLDRCQQNDANL